MRKLDSLPHRVPPRIRWVNSNPLVAGGCCASITSASWWNFRASSGVSVGFLRCGIRHLRQHEGAGRHRLHFPLRGRGQAWHEPELSEWFMGEGVTRVPRQTLS